MGRMVADASASKHCGSRLAGQLRSTMHVTPLLPLSATTNAVSSTTSTRACSETLGGAGLLASGTSTLRESKGRRPARLGADCADPDIGRSDSTSAAKRQLARRMQPPEY